MPPTASFGELVRWVLRRRRRVRVRGASMEPTLRDGDVVLVDVRAYDDTAPVDGDIVVARHPHRQIEIVKRVEFVDDGAYLRSDNRQAVEAQDSRSFGVVPADRVLGRVTSIVRAH